MYKTCDLGLSAALVTVGFVLIELNRANEKRVAFMFKDTPDLQEAVTAYFSGILTGPLNNYYSSLRQLKARLYSNDHGDFLNR